MNGINLPKRFDVLRDLQGRTSTNKSAVFGLDFGETPTDQLPSIIGKQPTGQSPFEKAGRAIEEYFRPTEEIRAIDFLREIPGSTVKVIKSIGGFAKSVQEEIAKSGASVGLSFVEQFMAGLPFKPRAGLPPIKKVDVPTQIVSEELPREQRIFKELIFGKDPIESLQTRIAKAEVKVEKFGKEKGIPVIEKGALPIAALGVGAVVGLDFTGWGGGKKQAVKFLAKTNKIDDVIRALKQMNVADDLISTYSKIIVKLNKVDDVAKALDKIVDIQKTTKVAAVAKVAPSERQFLTSVSKTRPDIPLEVGRQYIPRSTDDLAIKAKNLIKTDITTAEKLARTGTDDKAIATASELIKHYSDEATKATSKAAKNALYDNAAEIAHITATNLTEQGRAVQAASIMGRLTPEGMLRFAAKEINKYNEGVALLRGGKEIPQLTAEQTKHILDEFKRIEAMTDGTQKAMAFRKLTDAISDLIPSPMYKKLINVWKAGLLTGVKTSGLNTFSNLFHGTSETIKDIPAAIIDSALALFTKKRTLALTIKETPKGTLEGFQKGWRYLRTGFDERNVAVKLDWRRVNFGKSKFAKGVQKYEETIFHLMGAEDQPFYYGAKARSLMSQAIAKAKNKGLMGAKAKEFIENLVKSPTDEMLRYATGDAEIAVFQNPTMLGKIARAIQKAPGGEVIVPFGRTPSAVANQLINYSPAGIVKAIASNIGKGKFDQRLFSQAMGRGITGTGVMYLGTELFKKGLINLGFPKGEKEQKLWEIEGRKPNSIKIGDKWRDVNVLGPAGMVLIAGGHFQKSLEENGSILRALVDSVAGGAKTLTEQTFLRGINQVTEALNDPERFFEGWFSNTLASVIPTIVKDIGTAIDPVYRRTTGIGERFISRIPGARQTLEPRITVLGEERLRAGNWLETMIDPSRPFKIISSPVADELRRLTDIGYKVSPTLLGDREGFEGLTPEENTAMWKKVGELINVKLSNLFNIEQYKNLQDDQKAKLVETVIDKAKVIARVQVVMELTEGLSGQELKNKLSELKESGLMTREVFNKYLELQY